MGVGPLGTAFGVAAIDPQGTAAGGLAGLDIAPAVADQEADGRIHAVAGGAFDDPARLGLPAGAVIAVVVIAGDEIGQGELALEELSNGFDRFGRLGAARDIRLVG